MRATKALTLVLSSLFFVVGGFGQQPAATSPAVTPPAESEPITPAAAQAQREKQIRMYDPLDKSNPVLVDRKQGGDTPDPAPGTQRVDPDSAPVRSTGGARPLPGSIAASNAGTPGKNAGPQVLSEDGEAPVQEYTGPAVLSRSYTISRPMVSQQVQWTPTLGYMQSYDSGVSSFIAPGSTGSASPIGYSVNWGLTGRHFWKHDQFGLDYYGSQVKIGGISGYSGLNQSLNADYQHQISRRLTFNVVTSASSLSQNFSLSNPGLGLGEDIANLSLSASPTLQVLDQGTRQLSNQASVTWRKSARLSFTATSGLFFVQRTGGLYGNTGFQSQADVNYRYTRKTTIGVYYSHTNYSFSHRINVSDMNTVGGIYSYALGKSTQIRLRAGVTRIENQGQQVVKIDPAIAIYLGQSTGIVEAYTLSTTSDISAEIVRDFRTVGTASVSYVRGVSPGNGLLLSSIQEGVSGNFSRTFLRKYRLGASASSSSLSAVGQGSNLAAPASSYKSKGVGMSLTRPLNHHLTADFRIDYRTFDLGLQPGLDHQLRISTGLNWNPGENWLKSW